ncbi:MAG: Nif3-like dinuclear metal center hexameric protein [Deltaproteobacteria bacterium]|nr:Nif3-like dinuclear metal center hexameric protein [Deltaproteobacteria bacterium]
MRRVELSEILDGWLEPERFRDVGENGLQIEGSDVVENVICGVTANLALIEKAIEEKAQAIVVHHGLVWGGGIRHLKGWLKKRVALLLENDISLFAYHLPLDAHPTLGNNAGLADALGLMQESRVPFGDFKNQLIGCRGELDDELSFKAMQERVQAQVGPPICAFGDDDRIIKSIALCSGGAPDLIHEAIEAGVDLFLTGETTEFSKALADEAGICFIAGGHHHTERFGAQRLALALQKEGLNARFVDVENPA